MSMKENEITGLVGAYGWEQIPSKNPYMYSYTHKEKGRMNFYFTTGTLTLQNSEGKLKTSRGIMTLEALENEII